MRVSCYIKSVQMENRQTGKKIILAPAGSWGDVRPLLGLGIALQGAGHRVEVWAADNFRFAFEQYGLQFFSLGRDPTLWLRENSRKVMGRPLRGIRHMMRYFQGDVGRQFEELLAVVKGGADLMVGSSLQLAGPSVAEFLGIPYHHVICGVQPLISSYHPPIIIPWQHLPRWLNRLFRKVDFRVVNLAIRGTINQLRQTMGLKPVADVIRYVTANSLVVLDRELAPVPPDVDVDYIQTGYWHLSDRDELEGELIDFLRAGPPPVYIGFGSMGDPAPQKTSRILMETVESLHMRAVISRGWGDLGQGIQTASDRVRVIGAVPHAKLFPEVAAVAHHGGAGTVCTAARAGIPQVIVPHLLDQYFWGARIHQLGLGPAPLPKSMLTVKRLKRALKEALAHREIKENARRMAERLRKRDGIAEAINHPDFWGRNRRFVKETEDRYDRSQG